jgi:beta-glucosidase-like glycosyl hydrolase
MKTVLVNRGFNMVANGLTRPQKQREGTLRAIARDADVNVHSTAEEQRLMHTDAFEELVDMNRRTQSVNRMQKVRARSGMLTRSVGRHAQQCVSRPVAAASALPDSEWLPCRIEVTKGLILLLVLLSAAPSPSGIRCE